MITMTPTLQVTEFIWNCSKCWCTNGTTINDYFNCLTDIHKETEGLGPDFKWLHHVSFLNYYLSCMRIGNVFVVYVCLFGLQLFNELT